MTTNEVCAFCTRLLEWFSIHKRSFPWREGNIAPFASLVTELLLQRTKAESVSRFYPIILDRYDAPEKILQRNEGDMIADLSILGLQTRRAHSLMMLARDIKDMHGGIIPNDVDTLLSLHGIGKYIANAVLCFAFGRPAPIVDGNVTRVLCRYFGLENKGDNRRNKHLWEKSSEIIACQPTRAKEINWAILDFAALACVPRAPPCGECVLRQGWAC